jgi:PEP-CTERM motif
MTKNRLSAALLLAAAAHAQAAIGVDSGSFTYSQDFNSLTTSTVASPWANDSTLPGWSLFTFVPADISTIVAGTGSTSTGSFYSFGAAGSPERALGGTASGGAYFGSPLTGTVAGYIAVAFTNNSGGVLDGFSLSFTGEQWRNGGNTAAQSMVLEYGFGASFGAVGAWTAPPTLTWVSPVVGATGAAVDGNSAGAVGGLAQSFSQLAWAPGDTLWLRWVERNDSGNDHGLAIDDLAFSVSAVPEPGALALMLAGLAAVAFIARRRKA